LRLKDKREYVLNSDIKNVITALLPAFIAIFLGDWLLVFIYKNMGKESLSIQLFIYTLAEGIMAWILGKSADSWSRKGVLIIIHVLALSCLLFLYFYHHVADEYYYLVIIGSILFIPSPAARAYIIDHYQSNILIYKKLHLTTTRLIGISWLFQYLPWVFFILLAGLNKPQFILLISFGLMINLILVYFLFQGKFEEKHKHTSEPSVKFRGISNILMAFLLAQSVFFLVFSKTEFIFTNGSLFSLIGIGCMIGTLLSLFYKKIPHLSIITNSYGICFVLSLTGVLALLFTSPNENIDLFVKLQIVHLGALGGFYLPFVFDVVIRKGKSTHRGIMLAYLEIIQLIASLIGIFIVSMFEKNNVLLFSIPPFFYLIALFFQFKEEHYLEKIEPNWK
jgi:MFS family permease